MLNVEMDPCPTNPSAPTRGWLSARGWRTFRPGHCGRVPARGPGLALPAPRLPSRCTQGRKWPSGAPGPCCPLPSGQAPTPGWTKRRQYSRARHPFRGRHPSPGAPGVPAAQERAVHRGSARPALRDPGDRPGQGDPERLVLLSAPSGLAGDEEERVQAGTGAHTLACVLGRARDHTAARGGTDKTGAGDRQGDMLVDAHGAGMVVPGRPASPTPALVLWLGSVPSRGHPVLLAPAGSRGHRGRPGAPELCQGPR